MPRTKNPAKPTTDEAVTTTKYDSKRRKLPASGMAARRKELKEGPPKIRHEYNPHLPPALRFDATGAADALPPLLRKARTSPLSEDDVRLLAAALRNHEPWLEWSGKREKPWFVVDPVALHMHERVSAHAILKVLAREDVAPTLFFNPEQEYNDAVQAYKHDVDWANRMILGDSLQVMASLARREDLAGKVQMIYFDPPYGIRFGSNFQPQLGQRDVKDREQDLTREPEMVKAYRDTWTLGVHSYLAYLRDRLQMAKELLTESGSLFVQISDENLHRVRLLLDEVFGSENFINFVTVKKKSSTSITASVADYLLWYARDKTKVKIVKVIGEVGEPEDADKYRRIELPNGERINAGLLDDEARNRLRVWYLRDDYPVVSQDEGPRTKEIVLQGRRVGPGKNRHWTYDPDDAMQRLERAERLRPGENSAFGVVYWGDGASGGISNVWNDLHGEADPIYIVQTNWKVIERCMLMTTDPGDLVLDPTCGSGTTAYVAEQWGRRWITIDTSRVAIALARQRLLTARFPLFALRPINDEDLLRNPKGAWLKAPHPASPVGTGEGSRKFTFKCKTVPHITLKSIARNTALDPIFAKHEPMLQARLATLNAALGQVTPEQRQKLQLKLQQKQRAAGKKAISDADRRRWLLPPANRERKYETVDNAFAGWYAWEVPFDTDPDWPPALQTALTDYRAAWRAKMDEVNAAIAANADNEELVDKPEEIKNVVRVSGTFTVESVVALEDGPDSLPSPARAGEGSGVGAIAPLNAELEAFDGDVAAQNAGAHIDKIIRLLRAAGVDFRNNTHVNFASLEPMAGVDLLHAQGTWLDGAGNERKVAVSIGPDVGNLSRHLTRDPIRAALRARFDDLVFAAFGFDAPAQDAIDEQNSDDMRIHMALIRPDVMMDDLLKTQPGSQIFTVFSAPRVKLHKQKDGSAIVEMEGMDVYDPVNNTLQPTGANGIAAWFVDGDYDGRTFCITQAFFPDKSKWDKLAKALGNTGVIDEGAFDALSGTLSLPMVKPAQKKAGDGWRIAVKVIDPRGNEGMRVLVMEG